MATFLFLAIGFYFSLLCGSIGFDKLTYFRAEVNGLDIDDFGNGVGGKSGNVCAGRLGIDEENMLSLDGAQPPYPACERLPANCDAVGLKQRQKLIEYLLLVHIEGIRSKQTLKKEHGTGRYKVISGRALY